MEEIISRKLKVGMIGFCYKGKDKDREYACLILNNNKKIVSTISYVPNDGLTVGDYFKGRIEDFYYCIKTNNISVLKAEFELFDGKVHEINKTCANGYGFEKV